MAALSALNYNILRAGLKIMQSNENSDVSCESTNGNSNSSSGGNNTVSRITNITKTFNKITVQNVLNESTSNALNISNNNNAIDTNGNSTSSGFNNANAIVKKIKDFGMIGAVNAVNNLSSNYNSTNSCSSSSIISIRSNISGPSKSALPRKRPSNESKSNKNSSSSAKPLTTTTTITTTTNTHSESIETPTPAVGPTSSSTPTIKKPKPNPNKTTATPKSNKKKNCENTNQKKLIRSNSPSKKPLGGTPGRRGVPAPLAVARRNARERNRVKQVNNGFAALRERIPEEVAESFELQSNNRNSNSKKLSKVETLRMAVEYIRSLERLLGFDFPINGGKSSGHDGFTIIKNELGEISSGMDEQFDDSMSNYELEEDFMVSRSHSLIEKNSTSVHTIDSMGQSMENNALDLLPNLTTLNGLQYIRIPGTNTYQLLTVDMFACSSHSPAIPDNIEDDHFMDLIDSNCQSPRSSPSSAASAADPHSSPTTAATSIMQTTAAPALHQNVTTIGDHVKLVDPASSTSSSLSLLQSPVPQTSPNSATRSRLQQGSGLATPTLSPVGNELLLQTCADNVALANIISNERLSAVAERQFVPCSTGQEQQLMLPSNLMKRELNETDYGTTTTQFPNASPSIILPSIIQHLHHHSQQQRLQPLPLRQTTTLSTSPPLDAVSACTPPRNTPATLPAYFEHDQNGSFYESSITYKKEFSDALMDTSHTPTTALSDESMIDAIDWWEAHTPKSDGSSSVIM